MTPSEATLLERFAQALLRNAEVLILIAIAYGAFLRHPCGYVVTAAMALHSLLRRDSPKTFATWILVLVVGVTFIMNTVYSSSFFAIFLGMIHATFVENETEPLAVRMGLAAQSIETASLCNSWLAGSTGFMFLIGDAVTVWRAWAVSVGHRKPVFAGIFLWVCSFGASLTYNILNTPAPEFYTVGSPLYVMLYVGIVLPLATNVCAVGLIGYRTYMFNGFMTETLGPGKSKAVKVMLLLTESGIVYCIVQAINAGLTLSNTGANEPVAEDKVARLWAAFTVFFSAMLPPLIILTVNHQRSISDTFVGGSQLQQRPVASSRSDPGTIVFARRNLTDMEESKIEGENSSALSTGRISKENWQVSPV
ncbi:hypothetical protein FB451DRAFT_1175406 [Mycena latifolia]|nr:hypothetical protein FB451DRAFT_1175406 [Mycena latifolia]